MKPKARNLILELLLAANGEPLSARDAITACGLFGISANNTRVALARLSSDGLVAAAERGSYALGKRAHKLADDVATWRTAEQRVRPWHGGYVAVHCSGPSQGDRKSQRVRQRALDMLGFRELDRGLYLRPDNIENDLDAVRKRLYLLGLERKARVFVVSELDAATEARVRKLWDGRQLTLTYRKLRKQLEQWLAQCDRLDPDVAAREAVLLGGNAIRLVVYDPLLPDPLVDVEARHAFVETVHRFDRVGRALWRRFLDSRAATMTSSGAALNTAPSSLSL